MAINDATKYLKYANVQMAAESYFGLQPESANVGQVLQKRNRVRPCLLPNLHFRAIIALWLVL